MSTTTIHPAEGQELYELLEHVYKARQARTWAATTERQFIEQLGAVPPRKRRGPAFLVGEPWDHNHNGEAVYACFMRQGDNYQARYMSLREFNELFGGDPNERDDWNAILETT